MHILTAQRNLIIYTLGFKFKTMTSIFRQKRKLNEFTEVDYKGQKQITRRWVFSQKLEDGTYYSKSQVCCLGFSRKF